MVHVGLDLSRTRPDVHVMDEAGAPLAVTTALPEAGGLAALVSRIDAQFGGPVYAAIESMNGARFVHDQLELAGWQVEIADAQKVKGLAPLAAFATPARCPTSDPGSERHTCCRAGVHGAGSTPPMDPPGDQGGPGWRGDLYAVACGGDSLSLNRARPDQPASEVAESAVVIGHAHLGAGALLAQGVVLRARGGSVSVGNHSAVLENGVLVGWPDHPVEIGQRTVFGHRATVVGARVGNMCEIGNGAILLPGARLGDGCILGEGTLIPADTVIPDGTVLVGRPPHVLRTATDEDRARLAALRDGQVFLTDHPGATVTNAAEAGTHMGRLYAYRGVRPQMSPTAVLFDSAEITGDVVVGAGTIIGAGVKIIGDSHGPIRIGARVQILENTVLHLLPDNELVVEDDVVIGPGAMIHGCRLGRGTVVEPAAIVCDFSRVGAESVVRAGACVKQRAQFGTRSVLDGFPAGQVGTLPGAPSRPDWAIDVDDLPTLVPVTR